MGAAAPKPVANNVVVTQLTDLLEAAATDPTHRPAFFRALLAGQVYALGSPDQASVGGRTVPGTHLRLLQWTDEAGRITPFFTSEETLRITVARRPGTDPRFVRLDTRSFLGMLKGERLILDPDGVHGRTFEPSEVEDLLAGRDIGHEPYVVPANTQVLVGQAAHIPPDLPLVLAKFFASRPVVHQVHLGYIAYPAEGRDGYLLVVVADDREAAMRGFGMLQITDVSGGKNVDAIVVPPGTKHWLSNVEPIYVRPAGPAAKLRSLFGGKY